MAAQGAKRAAAKNTQRWPQREASRWTRSTPVSLAARSDASSQVGRHLACSTAQEASQQRQRTLLSNGRRRRSCFPAKARRIYTHAAHSLVARPRTKSVRHTRTASSSCKPLWRLRFHCRHHSQRGAQAKSAPRPQELGTKSHQTDAVKEQRRRAYRSHNAHGLPRKRMAHRTPSPCA